MKQRGRTAFFLTLAGLLLLAVGGMLGELLRHPGAPSVRGAFLVGGLAFTLGVTGFFGMLNQVLPLHRLFGPGFYFGMPPAQVQWLYYRLGVERLRWFLCRIHYHKPQARRQFYGGGKVNLPHLLANINGAEACHVLAFVAMLPLLPGFLYLGRYDLAAGAAVGNLLANFYPIVLQRQHRARLLRLGLISTPLVVQPRLHPLP